jgi:hypothetical protein
MSKQQKKVLDEVISLLTIHFSRYVGPAVQELDIHCDGCAGQSWNNWLALFCEEILDPESGIRNDIDTNLKRIDLYRGVSGHTYMQPDTEGGRIQRAARKVFLSCRKMFIHVMAKDEQIDPLYTKSWADVAGSLNNINLVLPSIQDFHGWFNFLLPPQNGGDSKLHFVPTSHSSLRGPHSTDKSWRITKCHCLNFGYGEDKDGKLVAHHGVWFGRKSFSQGAPDEIVARQIEVLSEAAWQQQRRCEVDRRRRPNKK